MTENRETFFSRLRPILAPSQLLDIELSYALAKHAHRWQIRKELDSEGHPIRYFEHLRSAVLILIDELEVYDPKMIIALFMHDSIEDTKDISARMLEHSFGTEVALMVTMLTKDPVEGYYGRLARFASARTLILKGCDNLSNMRTLEGCTPEFRAKQIRQSKEHVFPLMERAVYLAKDTPYLNAAYKVRDFLKRQVAALEAT